MHMSQVDVDKQYLYLFTPTAWKFICTVCSTVLELQITQTVHPKSVADRRTDGWTYLQD